jgi:hypothetical protein
LRGSDRSASARNTCVTVALISSTTVNAMTIIEIRRSEVFISG